MSRHHQRERSRDRHGYRGRSQSSDSCQKKKRSHHTTSYQSAQGPLQKRVKFNDAPDIKIFKKEDEPSSKGLTDTEVEDYMKKLEAERGISSFNNMNWENMKHRDAQLQNNSIREQKEKEKILMEKLQAIREQIPFYPLRLLKLSNAITPGQNSTERVALTTRLNDVLACFYVHQSQIPCEPSFQIQNKATAHQPKHINFDKQRMDSKDLTTTSKKAEKKDQKPLKGILKPTKEEREQMRSESQPRKINPALIQLLKEIQNNKVAYTKQKTQMLLRPYKQSGELDYLKKNPTILNNLMRDSSMFSAANQIPSDPNRATLPDPYRVRHSISPQPQQPPINYMNSPAVDSNKSLGQYQRYRQPHHGNYDPYSVYRSYQNYLNPHLQTISQHQPPNMNLMGNLNPQGYSLQPGIPTMQGHVQYPGYAPQSNPMYMPNKNYKTIPCKYFHSPQGCVKADNCTFIHDQQYAGKPTPSMLRSNRGMVVTNYGSSSGDSLQMGSNLYQNFPNEPYEHQN